MSTKEEKSIADEIIEKMESLGYKHQKLDECGNSAFCRDFEHGYIQLSHWDYFETEELFRAPTEDWHSDVLVQIYDMLGDVVYSHITTLKSVIYGEAIRLEHSGKI